MARYVLSGTSPSGAVNNSTPLMVWRPFGYGGTLRKIILGVEGATTYAQGPLEVVLWNSFTSGSITAASSPLAQDSQALPFPDTIQTAWSSFPSGVGTPLIRRSCSVLNESNWTMDSETISMRVFGGTQGFLVQTIGNNNPSASGLVVTWTAFFDLTNLA